LALIKSVSQLQLMKDITNSLLFFISYRHWHKHITLHYSYYNNPYYLYSMCFSIGIPQFVIKNTYQIWSCIEPPFCTGCTTFRVYFGKGRHTTKVTSIKYCKYCNSYEYCMWYLNS